MNADNGYDPLNQIKLRSLMSHSSGNPNIVIGIIDGPVDLTHPAFSDSKVRTVNRTLYSLCKNANSIACRHGTFVTGILGSKRGTLAPGICPSCEFIIYPIFNELMCSHKPPIATIQELSHAIKKTVDAGAHIINLSIGLSSSSLETYKEINDAYSYALQKGVIIVIAAGNLGNIGHSSLLNNRWIIPVAACDHIGMPFQWSNFGLSIGKHGLTAPGYNVTSTYPEGKYSLMSGTSVAAPFVSGTIALLLSLFPHATSEEVIYSLLSSSTKRRSIIPPLIQAESALTALKSIHRR